MMTSSGTLNLKLWKAAKDGDNTAVIAAIATGADVNWMSEDDVSGNIDNSFTSNDKNHDCIVDSRSHDSTSIYMLSLL